MYSAVCGANVMERGRHQTRAGEATPARSCAFHLRLVTHKRCAQKGGGRGGGVLQQLLSTLHTHAKHPGAAADRAAPRARRHFAEFTLTSLRQRTCIGVVKGPGCRQMRADLMRMRSHLSPLISHLKIASLISLSSQDLISHLISLSSLSLSQFVTRL